MTMRSLAMLLVLVPTTVRAERLNGAMVPAPSAVAARDQLTAGPHVQHVALPMTVYLNFDGPVIGYAEVDDSHADLSYIQQAAVAYAPYGDATARAAVVQAVQIDWADYAVTLTETRPAAGDYVMAVVSPTNPYAGQAAGIAPLDCGDTWTRNNVVFAFHGANDGYAINEQARTIGQEVAHSIGLEHTTVDEDIMSYAYGPADFWFADQCSQILLTAMSPEVFCIDQHAQFCGASQQNSHAELLSLIGAGTPDVQSPVLSITSPTNGASFAAGDSFEITATADDDVGVMTVELFSNDVSMAIDDTAPWSWPVNQIPAGTYELRAEARDAAGNVAQSAVVTIEVEGSPDGDPSGDNGSEPSDGSAGEDGGEDPDGDGGSDPLDSDGDEGGLPGDDDALPPGFGLDRAETSTCAVSPQRDGTGLAGLALLALATLRRRRR